jgi:hypothetical protein
MPRAMPVGLQQNQDLVDMLMADLPRQPNTGGKQVPGRRELREKGPEMDWEGKPRLILGPIWLPCQLHGLLLCASGKVT